MRRKKVGGEPQHFYRSSASQLESTKHLFQASSQGARLPKEYYKFPPHPQVLWTSAQFEMHSNKTVLAKKLGSALTKALIKQVKQPLPKSFSNRLRNSMHTIFNTFSYPQLRALSELFHQAPESVEEIINVYRDNPKSFYTTLVALADQILHEGE